MFSFRLNKSEAEKKIYKNTYFIVLFIVGKKLLGFAAYISISCNSFESNQRGKSYTRFAGRTKVNKICVKLKGLCLKWEHKRYKKLQVVE